MGIFAVRPVAAITIVAPAYFGTTLVCHTRWGVFLGALMASPSEIPGFSLQIEIAKTNVWRIPFLVASKLANTELVVVNDEA